MLKNYLTIAFRTLSKNKLFTAINILGLAIGISASLVIFLLVTYHFSFDRFEKDNERIYRVVSDFTFSGEPYFNSGVTDPLAKAVKDELTGLDAVVPIRSWNGGVTVGVPQAESPDKVFSKQSNFVFADSNFFNLVGYTWLAGSPATATSKPYNTVLTESCAALYFPESAPAQIIGKQIILDDTVRLTISGVVRDIEKNTDFTFKAFVAYTTLENTTLKPRNWNEWGSTNGAQQLFVKLGRQTSIAKVKQMITAVYTRNRKKDPGDNSTINFGLQPLSDLHFNGEYGGYGLPTGHKPTLYGLLAVAAFLLALACINFINLTTAYASQRAKEIGIRKTMGSSRKQLIYQFLSETFLLTFTATLLSIALTPLIIKAFGGFIPDDLKFSLTAQPGIIVFLLGITVLVTLFSGFYPALILSGYKPVSVLKNQGPGASGKTRNAWIRKSLTVSQFVIAQVFIMAALIVSKQITFSINKDLGFEKEAILNIETNFFDTVQSRRFVLLDKLRAIPGISMVSLNTNPPSTNSTWSGEMKYKDGKKEIQTDVQQKYGDSNYIRLYKLKLLAGTNNAQTDTVTSFIINETYAGILGFRQPQEAIGKMLDFDGKLVPIAGVVADFHQKSLREPIKPLVIGSWKRSERNIAIALTPQTAGTGSWKTTIQRIGQAWKEVYPKDDFEYSFFDESIAKFYEGEQHIASLLKWATGLAIFISCLGLLGLVIYTTNQRTKEIGVRKVLGASVANILVLVSREFISLVILAFIIAVPLAWIAMQKWLENFTYRTSVSWWIFALAGLLMTFVALLTVGYQTVRAAVVNPVKSLRSE